MTLAEFHQALQFALSQHFPQAKVVITESRGIILSCKAELGFDAFIAVYFNALTGKTSYALIQAGQRVTGYDNYKFWHYHPLGTPDQHTPCAQPTTEEAMTQLAAASKQLGIAT